MGSRKRRRTKKSERDFDGHDPLTVKQAMIKALVIGGAVETEIEASNIIEERSGEWGELGAVDPVLDLDSLLFLHEISDTLRQCVDAYVCNIEGNGHIIKPKIDLTKEREVEQKITEILEAEKFADELEVAYDEGRPLDELDVEPPTEQEIKDRAKKLAAQIRRETHIAKTWFANCSPKHTWEWLREKKRVDEEVIGHACWEVLRDSKNRVRRLEHMPGNTILPMSDDGTRVKVERMEWISEVSTTTVTESIMFRKYVQKESGKTRYFKEFGDPRAMDRDSGEVFEAKFKKVGDGEYEEVMSAEDVMKAKNPKAEPATEVFYFAVESPHTPAGMIRWPGWIVSIFGNRAAAESNLSYFENHAIPESALLVGGGQLNDKSVQRIKGQLTKKHKGAKNHNRLLILQATAAGTGRPGDKPEVPEMKWINLSEHQKGDSTFSKYTKDNQDGLTSSFRQSPILTGRVPSDLNRATAWAVLFQADRQVYGPLRRAFDRWVNSTLLPAIGCYAVHFESLSPVGTDIETMSKALAVGIKAGAFSPNEVRLLFSTWLNEPFDPIEEEWAKIPFAMTLNQISGDGT